MTLHRVLCSGISRIWERGYSAHVQIVVLFCACVDCEWVVSIEYTEEVQSTKILAISSLLG